MVELFANSGDPDQTLHFAASDLGLYCLPSTLLESPNYNGLTEYFRNLQISLKMNIINYNISNVPNI